MDERFRLAGMRPAPVREPEKEKWYVGRPWGSVAVFTAIVLGCLFCGLFIPRDPSYLDLYNANQSPGAQFWFGTDSLGRDIFSMIWSGGRTSLLIGFLAAGISTGIAGVFGTASGLAPQWLDGLFMRLVEILMSIPGLLLVIFLQAVLGGATPWSLSLVIGATSWTGMAKVVRTEVRQLRRSGYVVAARRMGSGFFRVLFRHLAPSFMPSILFMSVMNIRNAMAVEATLSFMGLGLPLEQVSWGGMLSLSEKAMLCGSWWVILIPGFFLVATLLCVTNIGNSLRAGTQGKGGNL